MNINLQHLTQKSTSNSNRNILKDLQDKVDRLNNGQSLILNYAIRQYLFYDHDMHESQETIGNYAGRSRQQTNIILKFLVSCGLLEARDRHGGKYNHDSLQYIPNKYLFKFKFYFYEKLKALRAASWMTLQRLGLLNEEKPILMGNTTPYKKIFISKPCKYILQLLDRGKSVYSRGMKLFKNNQKIKRVIMDEAGKLIISSTLRDITQKLRLTKLGQLKLLAFSDDVLRIVWGSFKSSKNVKSPFDWIVVGCEQYSKTKNIQIDWKIFYTLKDRYNVNDNGVYIQKTIVVDNANNKSAQPQIKSKYLELTSPHPGWADFYHTAMENMGL